MYPFLSSPTLPFRRAQVKKKFHLRFNFFCHSFGVLFPKRLIFKSSGWGFLRNNFFSVFQWAYFHPPVHFLEVFGRYLWNSPSTLKIEKNKMHFFFDFGSRWVLPKFSGPPWDPLGPPGGDPQGPRGGIKVSVQGIMVLKMAFFNF